MAVQNIAFYAPLKSPNHPVPSGDRAMAQGLIAALGDMAGSPTVELVSELRVWDGAGDTKAQNDLQHQAEQEITLLLNSRPAGDWQAWVTYHNYYKAPDLLGPIISKALNIPYFIVEASRSPKRLHGPWAGFAEKSESACDAADGIFYMTERDRPALAKGLKPSQKLVHLPPFLNATALPVWNSEVRPLSLLAVGMLRQGDKFRSYQELAQALHHSTSNWTLQIIGDGPAKDATEALFAPFGDRVEFLGLCAPEQVSKHMAHADLFVWPGVNEAFGMVYLEAQAHGLPVIAQDRLGVRNVVGPGSTLVPIQDSQAYARAIDARLNSPEQRILARQQARDYILNNHLRPAATARLQQAIHRISGKPT